MTDATEDAFQLAATPMTIGRVELRVRDLDRVAIFYRDVLGLKPLEATADAVSLGAGGRGLLHLFGDPSLAPRDPHAAGLFHSAFLLPSRADLGCWLTHAIAQNARISGASDHKVSEAIYLSDPEGNGIEMYADRPASRWRLAADQLSMTTDPLDLDALMEAATGRVWNGLPDGSVIGHVHLQVGDIALAERFYAGVLGFAVAHRYPGASFFASGGYHHQLAANFWNSRGAGRRSDEAAGLKSFEITLRNPADLDAIVDRAHRASLAPEDQQGAVFVRDPWGIQITLVAD